MVLFGRRLKSAFEGTDSRIFLAFWLFGLINNVLFIIILSAALDLVGPHVPKGVVLLADVVPAFCIKLVGPYFMHDIPYHVRVYSFVLLSVAGMVLLSLTSHSHGSEATGLRMFGIMLASISSGAGESSFLSLTHFYGRVSLAGWGMGTGAAGLTGAGAYVVATTVLRLDVQRTLFAFSILPFAMLVAFFRILPRDSLLDKPRSRRDYEQLASKDAIKKHDSNHPLADLKPNDIVSPIEGPSGVSSFTRSNADRLKRLIVPYMVPLVLVYVSEYTINQGIAPTLLYPLEATPFHQYRSFYPTYSAIYQSGVFVSRSSISFFRVHNIYIPALLQVANLAFLILHSVHNLIPNVYIVFTIIFWEGLLGGSTYVNAFAEIADNVPQEDREFSLGVTSVSDSAGICLAGFLGMALETSLCNYQVRNGRDWCKRL